MNNQISSAKKVIIMEEKLQKMFEKFERLGYTNNEVLDALNDYYYNRRERQIA